MQPREIGKMHVGELQRIKRESLCMLGGQTDGSAHRKAGRHTKRTKDGKKLGEAKKTKNKQGN